MQLTCIMLVFSQKMYYVSFFANSSFFYFIFNFNYFKFVLFPIYYISL